ncbi:MAG: N-formylglutamate amidohydrolase [Oricola sp.]
MTEQSVLLGPDDPHPVEVVNPASEHPVLLVCEHAGQAVPSRLGDLGLPAGEIERHIGWDIGAESVARHMAGILGCTLVVQRYSRLVIDCNRPPHAHDSMPAISDGTTIGGNLALRDHDREARIAEIFHPFHDAVTAHLDRVPRTAAVSIHSFTPEMRGVARPWDMGFLYRKDERTSSELAGHVRALRPETVIGMNEPYTVDDLSDWFVPQHGEARGLPHSLIEIRNDHVEHAEGQVLWAELLASVLSRWLEGERK